MNLEDLDQVIGSGLLGSALTFLGVYLTGVFTRRSAKDQSDIDALREAADEWRQLKDNYRTELDKTKAELSQLRHEVEADRVAHNLELKTIKDRYEMDRQHDSLWREKALTYVDALRSHIDNGQPPPPPEFPAGWLE